MARIRALLRPKWTLTVGSTFFVGAWLLSRWCVLKICGLIQFGGNHSGACVTFFWPPYPRPRGLLLYHWPRPFEFWPSFYVAEQSLMEIAGTLSLMIPLWMPLVILAIPTVWLWWRDRRSLPPGHCQSCGYNLTGNVSGTCPECGTSLHNLQ